MSESMYLFCDYLSELLCKQSKEMIGLRLMDGFFLEPNSGILR